MTAGDCAVSCQDFVTNSRQGWLRSERQFHQLNVFVVACGEELFLLLCGEVLLFELLLFEASCLNEVVISTKVLLFVVVLFVCR